MKKYVALKQSPLSLSAISSAIHQFFFDEINKGEFSTSFWSNHEIDSEWEPVASLPMALSLVEYAEHHNTLGILAAHVEPIGCALNFEYFSSGQKHVKVRIATITLMQSIVAKHDMAVSTPHYEYEMAFIVSDRNHTWGLGQFNKAFDHIGM